MKLTATAVLLLSLLGSLQSVWELVLDSSFASIEAKSYSLEGEKPRYLVRTAAEENYDLYQAWKRLSQFSWYRPEVFFRFAKAALVLSFHTRAFEEQAALLCQALSNFKRASSLSPHNPRYHIAWADIDAQIPSENLFCSRFGKGDFEDATGLSPQDRLDWALKLSPFGTTEIYLAAIVFLSTGDKNRALDLLKFNQEINPRFTDRQREYTYHLVTTEDELRRAIPHRFPEALYWVWHFSREREKDYVAWQGTFVEAVDHTIDEIRTRFREGKITADDFSRFVKAVNALPLVSSSQSLRCRLDEILANIYEVEGNTWWAAVLRDRHSMARLPVLKVIMDDKLPAETMLYGWVSDSEPRTADFDVLGRSIGIFLPRRHILDKLILQSSSSRARLEPGSFELLYSLDNLSFHRLELRDPIETDFVDGRETVVISLPHSDFRYLKIRYLGSNKEARFVNRFSELVQAYGRVLE